MPSNETAVIVCSPGELRELVRDAVESALADFETPAPPRLMTKKALGEALGCSCPTIDRLVRRGLPYCRIGDHKRFCFDECVAWLRGRGER